MAQDLTVIPVHTELPEGYNEVPAAQEREHEIAEWFQREEALCDAFGETGEHRWVTDVTPTFMCPDWIGYMQHCDGRRRWVDKFGQHDERCVAFREGE